VIESYHIAHRVAWSYIGTPYVWGGDDPEGFDCSGFVIEVLQSVGALPEGDWTADGLYRHFKDKQVPGPHEGCLVFWGSEDKMTHVEYCIGPRHSIGAKGGGSHVLSVADAMLHNAYIKVRPIATDVVAVVDPFKGE
jgi:cell wall-associated NlpC family hydrolase